VLLAKELKDKPVRIRRFGEELAVWRDSMGRPHVFQNFCPHRGASLALGKIKGEELQCWYHGWTFNGEGACTAIPLDQPESRRAERIGLKHYPAVERAGFIFAFYGDPAAAAVSGGPRVPYEFEDPRWSIIQQQYTWKTNWLNVLDNLLDPLHPIFLHLGAPTQYRRAKLLELKVTEDANDGFRLASIGVLPNGEIGNERDWVIVWPNIFRIDLADGTPRGIMRVIMMPVPVDDQTTYIFYSQARRVTGFARLKWKVAWYLKWKSGQDVVKFQDKTILESLKPIAEARLEEHMAESDLGVIHLRKRLNREYAKSQASTDGSAEIHDVAAEATVNLAGRMLAAWETDEK
jgi:phenylpropionate dioxygenase-like ring-hydroxylating dioxygenase large terminal subunit